MDQSVDPGMRRGGIDAVDRIESSRPPGVGGSGAVAHLACSLVWVRAAGKGGLTTIRARLRGSVTESKRHTGPDSDACLNVGGD